MTGNFENRVIRVGSRKSELALIQTKYVVSSLQQCNPDVQYEIHTMTTVGDRVLNKSLPKIGEKSLFTKDLEDALRKGGVDFVVHSLKDLPTVLPFGMAIGAVLEREDPRDALVLNAKYQGNTLSSLPKGSIIGTSSLRRSAQIARNYPHLEVCDIRGNLNTRLAKLDAENSKFAGIILAQAGLVRMGWHERINQVIDSSEMLYAVGQGALAVECRSNDDYILNMLSQLCHFETQCKILVERSFLKTLGGGCSAPVAVCTNLKRKIEAESVQINIQGAVWSLDGRTEIKAEDGCSLTLDVQNTDTDNANVIPVKKSRSIESTNVEGIPKVQELHQNEIKTIKIFESKETDLIQADEKLNLQKFISVHGDMFKKCPYSSDTEKPLDTNKNKDCSATQKPCPSVSFPVGIDFMGDCPYVSIEQKVDQQCILETKPGFSGSLIESTAAVDQCPFLKQQAKIVDYNENLQKNPNIPTLDDSEELFCGFYQHKGTTKNVFSECLKLGKRLAGALITKGALDVMKCAQNEIHAKV